MNAEQIIPIKELLSRNNYRVELIAKENGCVATFPERIEEPSCPVIKVYYGYTNDGLYTHYFNEEHSIADEHIIPCPKYAQRLLMLSNIIARCIQIGYSTGLIAFLDGEKEISEDEFYPLCVNTELTQAELDSENVLKPLVVQCMFSAFTKLDEQIAKETEVLDGYIAIRNMIMGTPVKETEEDATQKENPVDRGS
jgi:hypothetical protein